MYKDEIGSSAVDVKVWIHLRAFVMVCNVFIIVKANYIDLSQNVLKTTSSHFMFYSNYEKEGSQIIFDELVKVCTVQSSNRLFQLKRLQVRRTCSLYIFWSGTTKKIEILHLKINEYMKKG